LRQYIYTQLPEFDQSDVFQKFGIGSMSNYPTPKEFQNLMNLIQKEFPEVIRPVNVGTTYLQNEIPGYIIGLGFSEENWQ
jgi:hypothetical protein